MIIRLAWGWWYLADKVHSNDLFSISFYSRRSARLAAFLLPTRYLSIPARDYLYMGEGWRYLRDYRCLIITFIKTIFCTFYQYIITGFWMKISSDDITSLYMIDKFDDLMTRCSLGYVCRCCADTDDAYLLYRHDLSNIYLLIVICQLWLWLFFIISIWYARLSI